MQTTGNLGLKKPEGTDIVDIADLNSNMDILDNVVNSKVDKVSGKQLSTNDFTAAEKTKLAGIAAGANHYAHPNHTGDVISTGDGVTAIAPGVIVNADINATAAIDAAKIGSGAVSNTEFGYLDGVISGIQGQINSKLASSSYTSADVLAKLLPVDGVGSGLDAALFNGLYPSDFVRSDADFIEFRSRSTTAGPAYLDFHTSGYANDFDSRIIASGGALSGGKGSMELYADKILISGNTILVNNSQVEVYFPVTQTFSTGVWTKVQYTSKYVDNRGEYESSLATFVAEDMGTYLITACLGIQNGTDGIRVIADVWVNGGATKARIFDVNNGSTLDFAAQGSIPLRMAAGDYVNIYAYMTTGKVVTATIDNTYLRIIKIG